MICNKITWIDLQNPSEKEVESIRKTYNIHSLVADELRTQTYRTRVDDYGDHIFLVLRMPMVKRKNSPPGMSKEIDFVLGKDYLITVHHGAIDEIKELHEELDKSESLRKKSFGSTPVHILHVIMSRIFTDLLEDLDEFTKGVDKIERRIFRKDVKKVVEDISSLRHKVLNFRRALKPQQTVLQSLLDRGAILYGQRSAPYFRDMLGEYDRVWNIIENHKETLDALNDTHTSYLSTMSNEVIQRLTLMAFITFPLTLIATLFGMNTEILPFVGWEYDFWIISGFMAAGVICMFVYFKKKGWI